MYKIIGADQKAYGPISGEQIRLWLREGRVNAQTQMQAEGETDWKPLASFPEFADVFGGAGGETSFVPPAFGTTPPVSPANPDVLVENALTRQPRIEIGSCFKRGWNLVMERFWLSVGVAFVCTIVANVPLLSGVALAGLFWFFLKRIRGEDAKFEDAFSPFSVAFLQCFLAGLVYTVLVAIGTMLCVIPGILLIAVWTFTWPLLMDKRLDFWPAMETSRRVLWPNIWGILGLWIVSVLVIMLGALACYVGTLVAVPVVCAAQAYAYEDFFGGKTAV
jgi:hypothetical protein